MPNEIEVDIEDWLPRCVPFNGIEADVPAGIIGLPEGIFIEDLIKEVIIFDNDTEDGLKTLKVTNAVPLTDMVKPGMKVANLKFWETRIATMLQGSGPWIIDADGNKMTRKEWFDSISPVTGEPRHTDGLALRAMAKLNWLTTGGGVQVVTSPGKTYGVVTHPNPGAGTVTMNPKPGAPKAVPLGKVAQRLAKQSEQEAGQ